MLFHASRVQNATDGSCDAAVNAMLSAKAAHSFLGIDDDGQTAVVNSSGNKDLHLILRGGKLDLITVKSMYLLVVSILDQVVR